MIDKSNEDYLSSLSSEINAKNNFLSQRKNKIHNSIAHFHQISNDIRNRNQVLQSYTLNMLKTKQKLEKDKKSFQDSQNQKNSQLDNDFTTFENKLDSLSKYDIKVKQEIEQKKDIKNHYIQVIGENEKKIQDIDKIIQFNSKSNRLKLQSEIDQLSIVINETQNHYQQFVECVNSLDKDFYLLKKSKESIVKKQIKLKKIIDLEKSNYDKTKNQLLYQIQTEKLKQNEHRKDKKKLIQLKQKYDLKKNNLSKIQAQTINYLQMYEQKLKETSKDQSKILNQIVKYKKREESIKNGCMLFINYSNNGDDAFLNDLMIEKIKNQKNNLLHEIEKNRAAKNEINSEINTENLAISQHLKEIDLLNSEANMVILNEQFDSNDFPNIFSLLKEIKNLEKKSLNEIEKWRNCSNSSQNFESMLREWDKKLSI